MDAKAAVRIAKQYVLDLFEEEKISGLGLEEVALDEATGVWQITLGFFRDRDERWNDTISAISSVLSRARVYKVVRISDTSEHVLSVKNREVME